ncbi:hypothetical protein HPP92_006230, partial [Vanilla planifolia]
SQYTACTCASMPTLALKRCRTAYLRVLPVTCVPVHSRARLLAYSFARWLAYPLAFALACPPTCVHVCLHSHVCSRWPAIPCAFVVACQPRRCRCLVCVPLVFFTFFLERTIALCLPQVLGVGCWVLGVGCWVLGVGCIRPASH